MNGQDHHATLGVGRDASADQIRLAYRKLARKYHPDVSLFVLLTIAIPPASTEPEHEAWRRLAESFADFRPRHALEA